jgi:hypothetical protein
VGVAQGEEVGGNDELLDVPFWFSSLMVELSQEIEAGTKSLGG